MSKLQLYKASAGSGKTFRLAIEYLKIALSNEYNYKHILAVTFTNKATTEMKHRVVEELYNLSLGKKTAYLDVLKEELGLSGLEIQVRAKKSLKNILHDYSRFSVSTIDSFFQRVIKAFNRELGINTAYQVDLEENLILEEAVDQLLLSVDEDADLLEWLKQFAKVKILEGEGWNLKRDILSLGNQIYNETFKEQNEQLYIKLNDKTFIRSYRKKLQQIIVLFEKKLIQLGKQGLNVMEMAGLVVDDFKYGKSGPANAFNLLLNAELKIGKRIEQALEDASFFYKKTDSEEVKTTASKLQQLLFEAVDFFTSKQAGYNTAKLISKQLYTLAILVDLQSVMRKLVREKGVVLISESGNLLKEIISDADAPFVYEKTGTFYQHFMIDEFQDTSGLQWENFRPLINNSLSEDNLGLIVGDIKQAIYRWRSGDWRLLDGRIADDFPFDGVNENLLDNNWRSCGNVIRFNNSVFTQASIQMDNHFIEETKKYFTADIEFPSIERIYQDSIQQIGNSKIEDSGYIKIKFLKKEKNAETNPKQSVLDELIDEMKKLQDLGAKAADIAILVRKKDEAKLIADRLLLEKENADNVYNFNVLSSESLYVKSSSLVTFLLGILELINTPDDELTLALLNHIYYDSLLPRLTELNVEPNLNATNQSGQFLMDFKEKYTPDKSEQFEGSQDKDNDFSAFIQSESFKQLISTKNLQEVVFEVCNQFNLFELKEEQAYLQAFIDLLGTFMKSRTAEVSAFLDWWEEQGHKKTIAVSEDVDAIRIQTVHKAKGLEYNYVFIPFCDWPIGIKSVQHAPILWCKPEVEPFSELELVPVKYESSMADSFFKKEYFEEKISSYIDNFNLLYVAFTRARNALFTWSVYDEGKLSTVGDLLYNSMNVPGNSSVLDSDLVLKLDDFFDSENEMFEYGTLSVELDAEKEKNKSILLHEFKFSDFKNSLKLRKRSEDFFADDNFRDKINQGKVVHEVLAAIKTGDEVDYAVDQLVFQGVINPTLADVIRIQIKQMVSDAEVISWFDGSYRVLNERSILTGAKGIKRPDRIMIGENELIVVDYKSGEAELDKYQYQVKSYMRELINCGYKNVSGYIWYTKTNKRVKVET